MSDLVIAKQCRVIISLHERSFCERDSLNQFIGSSVEFSNLHAALFSLVVLHNIYLLKLLLSQAIYATRSVSDR